VPLIDAASAALVLVDHQQRLMPAIHEGDRVVAEAARLAEVACALGLPVIGTEQNPARLGPNVTVLRERCTVTLTKMRFDACADGLADVLRGSRPAPPREVVIAGCEAHVCLLQTALGLLDAGLRVWVVPQACGSRRAADHALAMARLQQAGATLVATEMVAFEGLRDCRDPRFKVVLQLVKPL
jgi:nicotinamidase-related amidase